MRGPGRPPLRFEDAVDIQGPNGCWLWLAGCNDRGYGSLGTLDGRHLGAHRLFYEAFVGPIPDDLPLDHLCRVTHCVNPLHLEPVTAAVNTQRGKLAKLTLAQAREIRASDEPPKALAARYGVSLHRIYAIRRGDTWCESGLEIRAKRRQAAA